MRNSRPAIEPNAVLKPYAEYTPDLNPGLNWASAHKIRYPYSLRHVVISRLEGPPMLSKGFCTLGLMATLAPTLHADWKITTVVRSGHGQSVQTEYFKGALRRIDQFDDIQGHHSESIMVLDFNRLRQTVWNTNQQDYVVVRMRRSAT